MSRALIAGLAAAAAVGGPAQAQSSNNSVTLFARGHYEGPGRTITGPVRLPAPVTVKSVKIQGAAGWDLCSGNSFTGCRAYSQSDPSTVVSVRSVRPAGTISAERGRILPPGVLTAQSLRGHASEYFPAPVESGNRVAAQPGAATAFCKARGWGSAAHEDSEMVGGAASLADVLCVR